VSSRRQPYVWAVLLAGLSQAYAADLPFPAGEQLAFKGYWNGVPVGELTAKVSRGANESELVAHLTGKTNSTIEKLYRFSLTVTSVIALPKLETVRYELVQREGKRHVKFLGHFDTAQDKFLVVRQKIHRNNRINNYTIGCRTHRDVVAALYAFRRVPLVQGAKMTTEAVYGKSTYQVIAHVGAPERIKIRAGTFMAVPLSLKVKRLVPPADPKKKRWPSLTAWVSNDARKLLLKGTAKTRWGRVTAELYRATPPPKAAAATSAK